MHYVVQTDVDDVVTCEIYRCISSKDAEEMLADLQDWFDGSFEIHNTKPEYHLIEYDPILHYTYARHLLRDIFSPPTKTHKPPPTLQLIEGGKA